jgi:hypothetical protein
MRRLTWLFILVLPALALGCAEDAFVSGSDETDPARTISGAASLSRDFTRPSILLGGSNFCDVLGPEAPGCKDGELAAAKVGGFTGPLFGLATAKNGTILVSDAATGIAGIRREIGGTLIVLPGVTSIGPIDRGALWATTGAGGDPTSDTGQALHLALRGTPALVANLFAFEAANDPDAGLVPDSNPYDVVALDEHAALVVDAGGNDLLQVHGNGQVDVLAVFPPELVSTANLQGLIGCPTPFIPDLAFICDIPSMPAEAVPTSVAIGPDGHYYVGELKGFPAPAGASNIWRVAPDASWAVCGSSPDCVKVFDGGFTSIIDLAFDAHGTLHVAELDELSWFALEALGTGAGGTINACDTRTQTCEEVAAGIPILTAITFGADGSLWATENALIPGLAQVIRIP